MGTQRHRLPESSATGRTAPPAPPEVPRLLDRLRTALRARHYSERTEKAYLSWTRRFVRFHGTRHPAELGEPEVNAFLTHLAEVRNVSASTQTQALSALLFLYREVVGRALGDLGPLVRARKPSRVPVVLTQGEVRALLRQVVGPPGLMAHLMYGAGLRLSECLELRVQHLDFDSRTIHVRDGKGAKDRTTMLPASVIEPLRDQLERVKVVHAQDLAEGWGRVWMPHALDRKTPGPPPSGGGSGSFLSGTDGATPLPADRVVTTAIRRSSNVP